MSVLALAPPAISMSRQAPAQPVMKHRKTISSLTPALLSVPQLPRRRCSAKVPITISSSYVSLGWWMVMSEDEQGYAPAAYLEPVEGGGKHVEQVVDGSGNCEGELVQLLVLNVQ